MNSLKLVIVSVFMSVLSMNAHSETPMMTDQQGNMPMMGNYQGMPMMGNQRGMMGTQQGSMPMMRNQQGNMPMMGDRQGMMQAMMSMRQQHMQQMENRLANIEALLRELVAIQKSNSQK
jgi:hypothetical protein